MHVLSPALNDIQSRFDQLVSEWLVGICVKERIVDATSHRVNEGVSLHFLLTALDPVLRALIEQEESLRSHLPRDFRVVVVSSLDRSSPCCTGVCCLRCAR